MRPPATFTRVSEKGQATIPADIRNYLNIQTGDYVAYEIDSNGQVILAKIKFNTEKPTKESLSKDSLKKTTIKKSQ